MCEEKRRKTKILSQFFLKTQTILLKFHMWTSKDGAGTDPGFGKGDQGSRYVWSYFLCFRFKILI